jgi:hypothetical protein
MTRAPVKRNHRTDQSTPWEPDDQLIAAVRCGSGSKKMSNLIDADRSWVVAGLTLSGFTAKDIADRLGCSLRLVRSVRAADMTQVCLIYQREIQAFTNQMALADSEARALRRDLSDMTADRDRIRAQFDRILDARLVGQPVDACGQGHLMTNWNTYWNAGRRWCRECHVQRNRDYRLARRLRVTTTAVRLARQSGDLDAFVQSVTRGAVTAGHTEATSV